MFREINTHKVNGLNEHLRIRVMDEPGQGNACHHYRIQYLDQWTWDTHFQEGPVQEVGVNGVSNEALLAIVRDRLEGFQAGAYACKENKDALDAIKHAMYRLAARTKDRVERGVEGTSVV
jgi:hypothetical protein